MIAHIQLEAIGYDQTQLPWGVGRNFWKLMPWCAEILGLYSTGTFRLKFMERQIRFDDSNSKMSRGVYFHFYPVTGKCYAAFRRTSWKCTERFWFRVSDDGDIVEIEEEEARSWAEKLDWEKTCMKQASNASRG